MTDSISGSIKFFLSDKKYGFITVGADDYFVALSTVEAAGFSVADMAIGLLVEFTPEQVNDKKRVGTIIRIGLQLATPKQKATDRRVPPALRKELPAKQASVEVGSRHVGQVVSYNDERGFGFLAITDQKECSNLFFHVSALTMGLVPQKGDSYIFDVAQGPKGPVAAAMQRYKRSQVDRQGDKVLFKIELDGQIFDYEAETRYGHVATIESLKTCCLSTARQAIGKVISHPVPATHGVKTNVPRAAGAKKEGGNDKKKAA